MSTTILFYTNNFLHRSLFESALKQAVAHAQYNDAKLLVTSHYPLFKPYFDFSEEFGGSKEDNLPAEYKDKCIKNLDWDTKGRVVNYLTGKLPYSTRSILKQLVFSCEQASTDNVVLFEHDCFYPTDYIKVVEEGLLKHSMTYCMENYYMVNKKGFYLCEPHVYLSSFAGRRDVFLDIMGKKDKNYVDGLTVLEPIVPYDVILKDIVWNDGKKHSISKMMRNKTAQDESLTYAKNEDRALKTHDTFVKDALCIDGNLGNQSILEFQHGLNTTLSLYLMRHIYDNADMEEKYKTCHLEHPYWGKAKLFTELMDFDSIEDPRILRNGVQSAGL